MSRGRHVDAHLTLPELEDRVRMCSDIGLKMRLQAVYLAAQGWTGPQIRLATGFTNGWITQLVKRYNAEGPAGLEDHRKNNGASPRLSSGQQQELREKLMGPAPDGGLWSGPKVAAWIAEATGIPTLPQLGWDYLQRLGFSLQEPRPSHPKSNTELRAAYKKNSAEP